MSNSEQALELLTKIYKEKFDSEPNYYAIKEHAAFFINGCPFSFYKSYKGLFVNTTTGKGGISIHKHGKHMSVFEIDMTLEKIFFIIDRNEIVLQVDGEYDYCNLTLKKEEFVEVFDTLPELIESAGYYSVDVSKEDENVVCLNLKRKKTIPVGGINLRHI